MIFMHYNNALLYDIRSFYGSLEKLQIRVDVLIYKNYYPTSALNIILKNHCPFNIYLIAFNHSSNFLIWKNSLSPLINFGPND